MSVADLSTSTQNYLKVIWGLQEWSGEPVTASEIADRVGLRLSTVSDAIRKLSDQGLVEHARYGSVTLTDKGRLPALAMVRRHRLIETFLVEVLHYTWDEVHDEAEQLEHAVSDMLVDRIDEFLGRPTRDPHGDPIPTADGVAHLPDAVALSSIRPGVRVRVERISDADPDMLKYFAAHGIVVDAELTVTTGDPYADGVEVTTPEGTGSLSLGRAASAAIWVSAVSEPG